ncbi:plasmid mobilization protein [Chryseobacterium mulctrae]|uniref:plasmid mobilization protein n=1 Tax=Chryseobacterium mulctrae TaxID=2576777 RepID=UPI0011175F4C|nr:plasmid mobilization relaxosome protein MobC [Chryseobacterium mulctrae]
MKNKGGRPVVEDPKKRRDKHIGFYVTIDEYKKIIKNIPDNLSLSEGFRTLLLGNNKQIYVPINFEKYISEVNKIGSNINQIAKKINTTKEINNNDLSNIKSEIAILNKMFEDILTKLNSKIDS